MNRPWARACLAFALLALPGLTTCGSSSPQQVVHVLGTWTGSEQDSFLADQVGNGTPPDLAVLSSPGKLVQYARAGQLAPLDGALDLPVMNRQYGAN